VSQHQPAPELPDPELDVGDRAAPCSADAHAAAAGCDPTGAEVSPGSDALVALTKLLARQAAQEQIRSQGGTR
jgi:hypothetical protein